MECVFVDVDVAGPGRGTEELDVVLTFVGMFCSIVSAAVFTGAGVGEGSEPRGGSTACDGELE